MRLSLKIEYLIILAITITPIAAESQSSIVSNYVRTVSPRVGSTAEPSDNPQTASGINPTSPKVTTAYVDGLGRKRSDVASHDGY